MTTPRPSRWTTFRTALRFATAVLLGLVVAVGVTLAPAPLYDPPGFGGGNVTCAMMMNVRPPLNWWLSIALFAGSWALSAYGLDRLLARRIGGHGRRASVGLASVVLVGVGALMLGTDWGVLLLSRPTEVAPAEDPGAGR